MKILIDIGHPAHVHLFKNFASEMIEEGNEVLFTVRDKENEIFLLKKYGFRFISFGKHYNSKLSKFFGLFKFVYKMGLAGAKFRPDIFISHGSVYAAFVSFLLRRPHIALEDTGNMEQVYLYRPFSSVILTPHTLKKDLGPKQIKLNSYHEIAYLHNSQFKKKVVVISDNNGIPTEKYCIIRLVAWNATHDTGKTGLKPIELSQIVDRLSSQMTVLISSERELESSFQKNKAKFPPDQIHNVISAATLVISEGATIAAEAGILGIPTIYVNPQQTCNNSELEERGCVFTFPNGKGVLNKVNEILENETIAINVRKNAAVFLKEKIDLTKFLVWFVNDFPASLQIIKEKPEYQNNFLES